MSILFSLFGANIFGPNKNISIFAIGGIILLLVIILLLFFYGKKNDALRKVDALQHETAARNEELAKINCIKDKLISIISHDIKSPLASLQSALALISENILEKEEFSKLSEVIEGDIYHLRGMLDNMLLWAREQVMDITIKKVSFNICDVIEEIICMYKTSIKAKDINVHNFILPNTIAFTDKDIIATVFRNIFSNAVNFSPPGKKIFIQQLMLEKKIYLGER